MNRKRARFDVVSIEITVHCPHCEELVRPPFAGGHRYAWDAKDIQSVTLVWCPSCKRKFQLPYALRVLLQPSTEPVRTDRRVSRVAPVDIICANCSGDDREPKTTLMTTDDRCASCGGTHFIPANGGQCPPLRPETNGGR